MDGWTESSKGVRMVIGIGYSRWEYFYLNQVLDCIYNRTPSNGKRITLLHCACQRSLYHRTSYRSSLRQYDGSRLRKTHER